MNFKLLDADETRDEKEEANKTTEDVAMMTVFF